MIDKPDPKGVQSPPDGSSAPSHGSSSGEGAAADNGTPSPRFKGRPMKKGRRHRNAYVPRKPKPVGKVHPPEFVINSPAQLPDEVLRDLLQDIGKPKQEQSPYFSRLVNAHAGLNHDDQRARYAIILAAVAMEGGNCSTAAKKLGLIPRTVRNIVAKHRTRFPQTPDQVRAEQEHLKSLATRSRKGVETLLDLCWNLAELAAHDLISLVKQKAIKPEALAGVLRVSSEKALVLSGLPTSRTAKIAERTMSDEQLEDLRKQNESILRELRGANPVDLEIIQGGK